MIVSFGIDRSRFDGLNWARQPPRSTYYVKMLEYALPKHTQYYKIFELWTLEIAKANVTVSTKINPHLQHNLMCVCVYIESY